MVRYRPLTRVPWRASIALSGILAASVVFAPATLALMTSQRSVGANALASGTLVPPSGLAATGGSTVVLTWTATIDTHAAGYNIYRGTVAGGPYPLVATVTPRTTETYTDAPAAGTYYYVVRAYVGTNWVSGATGEASATVSAAPTWTAQTGCTAASNSPETTGDGNGYEASPGNACANDGAVAVDVLSGTNSSTSCTNAGKDAHRFWDFGIALPGTPSAIDGIEVETRVAIGTSGGTNRVCVRLSWDGGSSWTAAKQITPNTTLTSYFHGDATDTWGRTWTAAELSNVSFRVRVIDVSNPNTKTFSLDFVGVRVSYTP